MPNEYGHVLVMCCGCMRLLGPDGNLITGNGPKAVYKGETIPTLAPEQSKDVLVFYSYEKADAACLHYGWTVVDGNHRCPECSNEPKHLSVSPTFDPRPRHGAYLPLRVVVPNA